MKVSAMSKSSRLILPAATFGTVALCAALLRASSPPPRQTAGLQRRVAAAAARGNVIPIDVIAGAPPSIDGDLSEWGDLGSRSGCIAQGVDDAPEYLLGHGRDAAVFKLAHDGNALY